jgi:hypothetical protein
MPCRTRSTKRTHSVHFVYLVMLDMSRSTFCTLPARLLTSPPFAGVTWPLKALVFT